MTRRDFDAGLPEPPKSKTQYVYEWLREQIVQGELPPGQPIRQQFVAQTLGVSYTPVREAIRRLESVGLVSHSANHGASVSELSSTAVHELYMLRAVMEGLGARLAVEKIGDADLSELEANHAQMKRILEKDDIDGGALASLSREFHAKIHLLGSPEVVAPRIQEIWATFPIPRKHTLWASKPEALRANDFHGQIIQAFQAKDSTAAASLMEEHIRASADFRLRAPEG